MGNGLPTARSHWRYKQNGTYIFRCGNCQSSYGCTFHIFQAPSVQIEKMLKVKQNKIHQMCTVYIVHVYVRCIWRDECCFAICNSELGWFEQKNNIIRGIKCRLFNDGTFLIVGPQLRSWYRNNYSIMIATKILRARETEREQWEHTHTHQTLFITNGGHFVCLLQTEIT